MQNQLVTSQAGIKLIKRKEGLRLKAYICPAGHWTIGWGHKLKPEEIGVLKEITLQQAHCLLIEDLRVFERFINSHVQVPLTQYQFDALVSFTFNFGESKVRRSTLLRKLNSGDLFGAADEFPLWKNIRNPITKALEPSDGLIVRREQERLMFLGAGEEMIYSVTV